MVLLDNIIEVFDLPQTCEARQLARPLHRFARARIGGVLVDCDRSWPHSMRLLQCLAKEAPRSSRIALTAQKEIDRLPSAVNGTVKICPPTLHFDVGLVHSPRTICHLKMGPHSLIDLRRVVLRPARHGRVINGNASIGQHPLKVSIADWKLKVPTHRPKDHVSRKMTASELIFALIHRSGCRSDKRRSRASPCFP